MSSAEKFISKFCQWAQGISLPPPILRKLPTALRKAIRTELPSRDDRSILFTRDLPGSEKLQCRLFSNSISVLPAEDKKLIVSVIMPEWRRGWSTFHNDDSVVQLISDFFFLASQYIARSRIVSVSGALALVYGRPCDFRLSENMRESIICPDRKLYTAQDAFTQTAIFHGSSVNQHSKFLRLSHLGKLPTDANFCRDLEWWHTYFAQDIRSPNARERRFAAIVKCINALDPYIHRIIHQYIKAINLCQEQFAEDAITALDGVVDIARQFVRDRLHQPADDPHRKGLAAALRLSKESQEALEWLYLARCYFGAHPSPRKWWDFSEMYEKEVMLLFDIIALIVWRVCQAEVEHRVVETEQTSWSSWFDQHALMLWDAVWFEGMPTIPMSMYKTVNRVEYRHFPPFLYSKPHQIF